MNRDNRWTMLLAGIGIGAAAGVLLARCSGAELRGAIQQRAGDATDFLKSQAGSIVDRAGSLAETGHDKMVTQLAKGKELARDLNKNAKEFIGSTATITSKAAGDVLDKSNSLASKAAEALKSHG